MKQAMEAMSRWGGVFAVVAAGLSAGCGGDSPYWEIDGEHRFSAKEYSVDPIGKSEFMLIVSRLADGKAVGYYTGSHSAVLVGLAPGQPIERK